MTKSEIVNQAYTTWRNTKDTNHRREDLAFVAGYEAGRESVRAEVKAWEAGYSNLMHENDQIKNGLRSDLRAERERSQNLIELLHSIDRRAGSASHQSGWTDAIEVADWARKAIADYEAIKK